jgi:hypothetical protein
MPDPFQPPDPDLSPSLGGSRARPEDPAALGSAEEPAAQPAFAPPTASPDDLAAMLAEVEGLLGPEGAEMLEALAQIGTLGQGLSTLFSSTIQAIESQLPQAIAAFEGLMDAVGQAVDQAMEVDPDDEA